METKEGESLAFGFPALVNNPVVDILPILSLAWTTDGYALAVQVEDGWGLFSPFGDMTFWDRKAHQGERGEEEGLTTTAMSADLVSLGPCPGRGAEA